MAVELARPALMTISNADPLTTVTKEVAKP
jgi:hypothetical protein